MSRVDLAGYRVTDRDAGLFDAGARVAMLRETTDPVLSEAVAAAPAPPCEPARQLSMPPYLERIPRFYTDRQAWREATRDLRAIEEVVGRLAAAFVASGDRRHADCLVDLLAAWADRGALAGFHFAPREPQGWFQLEGLLFVLGLSYAVVRPFVRDRADETAAVETWLSRASRRHLAVEAVNRGYCWNNHFYRRGLQAAAIGVVAGDDELFRYGAAALHFALGELGSDGALPREMRRGPRVVHYQNYSLLYLVPIVELIERQGYPAWDLAPSGRTLHDAVDLALDLLADPRRARRYTRERQDLSFAAEERYFAWMEVYRARFGDARVEAAVAPYRPVWSRLSIGAATLYFYAPDAPQPGGSGGEGPGSSRRAAAM
jgi:poly(beta-D-mannuronate) lyase